MRETSILIWTYFRESNAEILEYMKAQNITGKFRLLESLYMNKLMGIISNLPQKKQTAGNILKMHRIWNSFNKNIIFSVTQLFYYDSHVHIYF